MIIKVAFFKAYNNPKANLLHTITAKWTKGIYSHVELVIPEIINDEIKYIAYTATFEDMCVIIKEHEINEDIWDYEDLCISNNGIERIKEFFKLIEGRPYDIMGIFLSQIFPLGMDNNRKWFCSECVTKALLIGGLELPKLWLYKPEYMSPNGLARLIRTLKYE